MGDLYYFGSTQNYNIEIEGSIRERHHPNRW